jgi:GNAT superfamily N-acetyltransferase
MKIYPIRQAAAEDLPAVMELRRDAERWLESRGIGQWTSEWAERAEAKIGRSVEDGQTWIVFDGPAVAATVSLGGPDFDFWNEADDLAAGLHLYKLIVARSHAGDGLAAAVIDWVSRRARGEGKTWVRLDCSRENTGLHTYYRRIGFQHVRTEVRDWRQSGALFQRPAGVTTNADSVRIDEAGPGAGAR